MVDISAIAGLTSSLKAIGEITKAMIGLRDNALLLDKSNDLLKLANDAYKWALDTQESVLSLHNDLASALKRERELEAKISQFENWNAEKQRYRLVELSKGVFAYTTKNDIVSEDEPPHCLCPNCYGAGKKSILQSKGISWEVETLVCLSCAAKLEVRRPGQGIPNV